MSIQARSGAKKASSVLCSLLVATLAAAIGCGDNDTLGGAADAGDGVDAPPVPDGGLAVGTCGIVFGEEVFFGAPTPNNRAGIPAVFNRPDGTILGTEFTDVKGSASRDDCVAGTSITLVLTEIEGPPATFLVTYGGVQPGDTVWFGGNADNSDNNPYADVNITAQDTVSIAPSPPQWQASLGCASSLNLVPGTTPSPISIAGEDLSTCLGTDGNIDVLGALLSDGGSVLGYSFAKDLPLTVGTMGARATTVANLPAWTEGNLDNALTMVNIPLTYHFVGGAGFQLVDTVSFADDGDLFFGEGPEGIPVYPVGQFLPPIVSTVFDGVPDGFGEQSGKFGVAGRVEWPLDPDLLAEIYSDSIDTFFALALTTPATVQSLYQEDAFNRTIVLDFDDRLPRLASTTVSGPKLRPTVHWTADAPLDDTDLGVFAILSDPGLILAEIAGEGPPIGLAPGGSLFFWFVIAPVDGVDHFTTPELPPEILALLSDVNPTVASGVFAGTIAESDVLDYRAFVTTEGFNPAEFLFEFLDGGPGRPDFLPEADGTATRFRSTSRYYSFLFLNCSAGSSGAGGGLSLVIFFAVVFIGRRRRRTR